MRAFAVRFASANASCSLLNTTAPTDGEDGYKYPFKIQNATDPDSERIFHLEASSAAERKQWFDAFEKMARLNDSTLHARRNVVSYFASLTSTCAGIALP